MKRYHLPALLAVALIATCAAIGLREAYQEGVECRARGGVIIESDASSDTATDAKFCTVDY